MRRALVALLALICAASWGGQRIGSGVRADIIGVEWNQGTDTWRNIDAAGNTITPTAAVFNSHPVWGGIRRCNMSTAGVVNAWRGGAGYVEDGTNGRVMVRVPRFWTKTANPSANVYQWYVSDAPLSGYALHPAFVQTNGGSVTRTGAGMFIGAYAADLHYDSTGGHVELHSRTGRQPFTGTQAIWSIPFASGANEPAVGDDVSTTEANMYVVDWKVTTGTWAGGNVVGVLYVRKPGDDANGSVNAENIVNNTRGNTLGVTTSTATAMTLTLANARGYAHNIGTGWEVENIWEWSAIRLLMYIEYKGAALDTGIGLGIINKASGTGYDGEVNGKDSIDSRLAANGTGTGSGTNGLTPVAWRGIENPWGNVWQWIEGWNAVDGADAANDVKYRLLKADGTTTLADTLATYDELAVTHTGLPDGYVSNIHFDNGFQLLFLPSAVAGGATSHLRDYLYEHNTGQNNALLAGGSWAIGAYAGPGFLNSYYSAGHSARALGARLSFLR